MAKQDFHCSCWNWHHAYVKSQGFYSNLRKIRVNERYNEKIRNLLQKSGEADLLNYLPLLENDYYN